MSPARTPEQALSLVQPGHRVFVHGGAATPNLLLDALVDQAARLHDVEMLHLHTHGPARYAAPEMARHFRVASLFVGGNLRRHMGQENIDYLPCFLSEIPALLRSGRRPVDVALVQVSPPDQHGLCSLGVSVDVARAAVDAAKIVIALVNPQMPRAHGDGFVHQSRFDAWVEADLPLEETPPAPIGEVERAIGRHVAELIEDGSTLQMGIGAIPDAVLASLHDRKHLGVHTEMFSDGLLPLIQDGVVDNSHKTSHPGRTVAGFVIGTKRVFDFLHDNPRVAMLDIEYVNRPGTIRRNPRVVAINSAVEVDLTGQVCADSIGHRIISGVGGQMDFIRGASLSEGGKPIIALPSRTKRGEPRIVATLKPGAGVVTTRAHVHYVATEYGLAHLYGRTLSERAQRLINIAHPDDREQLAREWREAR